MTGKNGSNTKNQKQENVAIFFNSTCTVTELSELRKKHPLAQIICFDFESHELLKNSETKHLLSDNYLDEEDIANIQRRYYEIYEWYEQPQIRSLVEYGGVNMGQLFSEELVHLLVKTIKNSVGIMRICEKNTDTTFLVPPSLYELTRNFTPNAKKSFIEADRAEFVYDYIRYNFRLGNKYFLFKVPRSTYLRIKKLSEIFIHVLFGPKLKQNRERILLVELNTARYKEIFSQLSQTSLETFFFGRRRPAIWNGQTYSIIKNSNCRIVTGYSLLNSKVKELIGNGIMTAKPKIEMLWKQAEFFNSFFSVGGYSFWKIIEPYFKELIENRLNETITEIELAKELLTKYKFKCILLLAEVGFTEQIIVKTAKSLQIPVFLHQLGLHWDTKEASQMNKSQGVYPANSNKFLVWGKVAERDALRFGVSKEKIAVIGAPRWDDLANLAQNEKNDYVLLATSGPQREDINGLLVKNNELYLDSIKTACEIVTKLDKRLIVKLHPSPYEFDVTDMVKKINPDIEVVTTGDILPLIRSCSVMIMLGMSTAIMEALICKKPVMVLSTIDYNLGHPTVFDACIGTNMENLEFTLQNLLGDDALRQQIVNKGTNYVNECLANQGMAAKKLVEFMQNF